MIWGGARSNLLFRPEGSGVELPTPYVLAELRLPVGENMFPASCDISQFYNQLATPAFLVPYLGPPKVRAVLVHTTFDCEFVIPCLRCVPMGATFAVSLAQSVSLAAVRSAGREDHNLDQKHEVWLNGGPGEQVTYVDDVSSVGICRAKVNASSRDIISALEKLNLPTEAKRRQVATILVLWVALGLWRWQEGVLTVRSEMVVKLR